MHQSTSAQTSSAPTTTSSGNATRQHVDHQFDRRLGKLVRRDNPSSETPVSLPALNVIPRSLGVAMLDYAAAAAALLALVPVFVVMAIYIKIASPGPVFFRHQRFGVGEKPFRAWKFRTMSTSTDPTAHARYVQALADGNAPLNKSTVNELIPLGHLIRDLGIDELPQFMNVIAGQMSLVGPRPDVFDPTKLTVEQRKRYQVLPGITGLWQISGKNDTTFEEMIDLDVEYVQRRSVPFNLQVMLTTPIRILSQFSPRNTSC